MPFHNCPVFSLLTSQWYLGWSQDLLAALESAWVTVKIAIDENAVNTSHSTQTAMRCMGARTHTHKKLKMNQKDADHSGIVKG